MDLWRMEAEETRLQEALNAGLTRQDAKWLHIGVTMHHSVTNPLKGELPQACHRAAAVVGAYHHFTSEWAVSEEAALRDLWAVMGLDYDATPTSCSVEATDD